VGHDWVTTDDGVRLWHTVDGTGPPLALVHGGPGLGDNLGPLAELLADRAQVVRWDQRGSGRSDPVGPHTLDRYVADLDAVRRHLGPDRWVVGGHSFGATIALQYALAHPERTTALVYVAGVGTGRAWRRAYRQEADRRLTAEQQQRRDALFARERTPDEEVEWRALAWVPDFADPDRALEQATVEARRSPFPICWEANRALGAEVRALDEAAVLARCRRLTVPVLVLHGADDPRPAAAVDPLAAALPDARVVVVPGAGHLPWVEAPDAVRAAITAFLREVSGSRG